MQALDVKLLRDLRRIWAQSLAIALVLACGIMVLVMATGTQKSLTETRDAFCERNRFADVFAQATRAPRSLLPEIAAIPGVAMADARISIMAVLDLDGMQEPANAVVLSLSAEGNDHLNLPLLRKGRMPDPSKPDEAALAEPFAQANHLDPGDHFFAILNGQRRELTVTGHVLSPELIYSIGPASMMPDDRHFGVIWMGEPALAAATNLGGAFNDLSLSLSQGANEAAVIAAVDRILARYGSTGAYGRSRQVSNTFLQGELSQLQAMAMVLPPIFLIVSALLVNMVLGRLIALERQQIGLLKAVGYTTRAIAAHYLKMSLGIGVMGVAIGWAAGWGLGRQITQLYTEFFRFPFLIYVPGTRSFVISGALGMATVIAGALRAVWSSVRLTPAVAMSPPAPAQFRRGWGTALGRALRLRQTSMMIVRSITRWPARAAVTLFGVSASVAVLVGSFFAFDALGLMMDEMFTLSNRQQVTLMLAGARNGAAVQDALALPGVRMVEGAFALPVRVSHGAKSQLVALQARAPGAVLTRVLDTDGAVVQLPETGLAMPERLARTLDLIPGDMVAVELLAPPRETWILPVSAVIRQSLGQDVQMSQAALFAQMRQAPQVNQLNLLMDTDAMPALYHQVKRTPAIAGLTDWLLVRAQFDATINESFLQMTLIYCALGMLITIGVVYNAARIQLSERAHELASLRVLGFSRVEVGYVLVGELMLLTLVAIPIGWAAGYGLVAMMVARFSTDLVTMPFAITPRTYAFAALVVGASALGAALVVRCRLDRVEIASALKQKE